MPFLKHSYSLCRFSYSCYGRTRHTTNGCLFKDYLLHMWQCSRIIIFNRLSFLSGFYRKIFC